MEPAEVFRCCCSRPAAACSRLLADVQETSRRRPGREARTRGGEAVVFLVFPCLGHCLARPASSPCRANRDQSRPMDANRCQSTPAMSAAQRLDTSHWTCPPGPAPASANLLQPPRTKNRRSRRSRWFPGARGFCMLPALPIVPTVPTLPQRCPDAQIVCLPCLCLCLSPRPGNTPPDRVFEAPRSFSCVWSSFSPSPATTASVVCPLTGLRAFSILFSPASFDRKLRATEGRVV